MTGHRIAGDGVRLATYRWEPTGPPRSAIVLVHGLAEYLGRYEHVGSALAARGHLAIGDDIRGFGRSGGRRAHVDSWDRILDDLAGTVAEARRIGVPVVLLGHSLGGLIAASYVIEGWPAPDLLVLSAPAIDDDLPAAKKIAARVLGVLAPRLSLSNGLTGDQLSHDPAVGERYFADPLVHTRTTLGFGRQALRARARVRRGLDRIAIPTLVIHSGQDSIVPAAASEPLAGLPGVSRVVFPHFRHESFNEDGGSEAIAVVASWIEARL